ncbi:hypothetical protein [Cellulophaga sp. HaHa_2_1]|uniref:hypothetical protein n=1 Tax=Cellulophaga sp. HaHa_2_1 TaxID=2749994 RepID=UPI001C4EF812|nr:hypothetical protein [Cellulophaga sp. HaHa_2_1]QXP53240.1 hypothetical protein H0I24_04715 [Cellulophaga sp. HaHa_2_1]
MKKGFSILILLFITYSCKNATNKEVQFGEIPYQEPSVSSNTITILPKDTATLKNMEAKIDIGLVKQCSEEGITSFHMDSITDTKKYLDNSIVENALGKIPVNGQKDWLLKANEWERFSCYQWEENQNYFLFTLLQKDESCCLTLFLCVADKEGELVTIRLLGLSGADGGWYENDWGERKGFGKFKLFHDSHYDEDKFENGVDLGITREHEYTELEISLKLKSFQIDTINYHKTEVFIKN